MCCSPFSLQFLSFLPLPFLPSCFPLFFLLFFYQLPLPFSPLPPLFSLPPAPNAPVYYGSSLSPLNTLLLYIGRRQASLVLIAYASSDGSGPEPSLLAHTSSESRGTFRQKARSLAPLNDWACAVKIYHDGMLEDTNSLDAAHIRNIICTSIIFVSKNFNSSDSLYKIRQLFCL